MGRMLGVFADDEDLDRPDLNKCPDCGCFFAQEACPLCGKICPEEMRAGNRPAVKHKKKRSSNSDRVTFISWYHSWWFIIIMMFLFPLVGIILLVTSPHARRKKILFVSIAAVCIILSFIGIGNIISKVSQIWEHPVDTSLTRVEYVAACQETDAEQLYRFPETYEGDFVCITLKVIGKVTYTDDFYNDSDDVYYLCEAEGGSSFKIILRDCLLEDHQKLIAGDVITVYGEAAGECVVYDGNYTEWEGPCLNMAYMMIKE